MMLVGKRISPSIHKFILGNLELEAGYRPVVINSCGKKFQNVSDNLGTVHE